MKSSAYSFSFIFIFLVNFVNLSAQIKLSEKLSYEKIEKKIDSLQAERENVLMVIQFYIRKSKKEKNNQSLLYGYRYASKYYPIPTNIKYADSAISVAKKSENLEFLSDAYLNKGTILMDKQFYEKALNNILIANKYSIQLNDAYLTNKTSYLIAQNKIFLGNYEDANSELKKCINYFKNNLEDKSDLGKNSQLYYIYSLMSILDTNTKIGKQNENKVLISEIKNYLEKNKLTIYTPYFTSIEGTDAYYNGNYNTAIKKLKEALRQYNDQWSHNTEVFYIGLSNWKLGKRAVAIKYLEEIDKEYEKEKKLDPQFRSAYEILIRYSDSIGNTKQQLDYINKLMSLDKSYEKNYKYLYNKINKEYDTQKLVVEKKRIEKSLKLRTYLGIVLALLLAVFSTLGYRFYKLQKIYKARFLEIVSEKTNVEKFIGEDILKELNINDSQKSVDEDYYDKIDGLKAKHVMKILKQLKEFEEKFEFKDSQLSIKLLSERFGTNYVYLSKVINEYRGKNFNIYINDLRLEYVVNLLKDKKYFDLDIKELSAISGFATANNFSSNFVRKYKIKPSYFIKSLKNNF